MTLYSVISVTKLYDYRTVYTLQSDPFCPSSKYLLLHISGYTRFWLMTPQVHLKATFQFLLYCQVTDSFIFLNFNLEMENLTGPVCLLAPDYVQICWRAYVFAAAAAAAKSLQSCPTLCNPRDGSPPGSPSLGFSRQEHWSGLPFPSPMRESEKWKWGRSVVSDSYRPHGLQPTRLLRPWDFPGKSTGLGCHCLLHCGGRILNTFTCLF